MKKQIGTDKVYVPGPNNVFVFGSNLSGIHGAGAARAAFDKYGARWGVGVGHCGNSYAIPTKDENVRTMMLKEIKPFVLDFLEYATFSPAFNFFVTRIGCGLAGYTDKDIAPMFKDAPENCELPYGWDR